MIIDFLAQLDWGQLVLIGLILFLSTFVVRVSGFGGSLVAIPLLAPLIGIAAAPPLMNLFGATNFTTVVIQKWRQLTFNDVWRLAVMNVLITPIGIYALNFVSENFLRIFLGVVCIGYAGLRMLDVPFPKLERPVWQLVFGFVSGIFSGTFGVGGVPAVLYADTQSWDPERFRLNMFSFFAVTTYVNIVTRFLAGQYNQQIVIYWLASLPFLFCGLWLGEKASQRVNPNQFKWLVLILLVVLGGRLIYSVVG